VQVERQSLCRWQLLAKFCGESTFIQGTGQFNHRLPALPGVVATRFANPVFNAGRNRRRLETSGRSLGSFFSRGFFAEEFAEHHG
jgi:hypothetical protein